MADEPKPKKAKPEGGAAPKAEKKAKAPEGAAAAKAEKAGKKAEKAEKPEKKTEAPRPPADPRLKVFKKFKGRFLPKGPLRDRHIALIQRWNSGEDHGGVTVEELKALYEDWKASRAKPARA